MGIIICVLCLYLTYLIYDFVYKKFWSKNLFVSLNFEKDTCTSGEKNSICEVVLNKKILPVGILRVRFYVSKYLDFGNGQNVSVSDMSYKNDVFSVMFFQKITRKTEFLCRRRGFYSINKIELVSYNLFLKSPLCDERECNITCTVLPKAAEKKKTDTLYNTIYGDICLKRAQLSDPFEFVGIRKYETYDSIRDINWKASAKSDELMVNVHGYTAQKEVVILLNVLGDNQFTDDRVIEYCISIASSFAVRFVKSGVPVGLLTNGCDCVGDKEINIDCASGNMHAKAIRRALARCDINKACDICEYISNMTIRKNTMYIIISSASKKEVLNSVGTFKDFGAEAYFINVYKKGDKKSLTANGKFMVYNWEMENFEGI